MEKCNWKFECQLVFFESELFSSFISLVLWALQLRFKAAGKASVCLSDVRLKNYERKTKFTIYDLYRFESIFVPEDNENQNLKESYTSRYQKYVAYSYDYKLVLMINLVIVLSFT